MFIDEIIDCGFKQFKDIRHISHLSVEEAFQFKLLIQCYRGASKIFNIATMPTDVPYNINLS